MKTIASENSHKIVMNFKWHKVCYYCLYISVHTHKSYCLTKNIIEERVAADVDRDERVVLYYQPKSE